MTVTFLSDEWAKQNSRTPLAAIVTHAQVADDFPYLARTPGKAAQKCKVMKSWKTAQGAMAYQVQALGSGEIMTIVESGPVTTVPGFAEPAGTANQYRLSCVTLDCFHKSRKFICASGTPLCGRTKKSRLDTSA